jgi:hypothetical protein
LRSLGTNKWELSAGERKRILLDHIFGVDIDAQAVEVTKLSLLLKCLEGESDTTINQQLTFLQERALPDLENNIRCGNSLIATDFTVFDPEVTSDLSRLAEINMFDWRTEFPVAFVGDDPGFDVVLGNPPYVLLQDEFRDDFQLAYFRDRFKVAAFKLDLYHLFLEQSLKLTRAGGWISMITPSNYLTNNHLAQLRRMLIEESDIKSLTVIDGSVFPTRSVDCAIIAARAKSRTSEAIEMLHAQSTPFGTMQVTTYGSIDPTRILATEDCLFTGTASNEANVAFEIMENHRITLGSVARVHFGKQLRNRKLFQDDVKDGFKSIGELSPGYVPCYTGRNVNRWSVEWSGIALFDNEVARMGGCWDASIQNAKDKLITRQIGRYPEWGIDVRGYQCLNTVFMVDVRSEDCDPHFLLGVLNSSPLRAYWLNRFFDQRTSFPKIKGSYLKKLPLPRVPSPEAQTQIAQVVKELVRLAEVRSELAGEDRQRVERGITGQEILLNQLIGSLYGLSNHQVELLSSQFSDEPL